MRPRVQSRREVVRGLLQLLTGVAGGLLTVLVVVAITPLELNLHW